MVCSERISLASTLAQDRSRTSVAHEAVAPATWPDRSVLKITLQPDAVSPLGKHDGVVLLVLQLGAVALYNEVADVKLARNIAGQRVVTEQCDTAIIEGMTVPGHLAFGENYGAIGCGRNDAAAHIGVFYGFNANVALEEERHETLQHVVTVVRSAFGENAMTISSAGDLHGSCYMWAVFRLRSGPRGTPQAGKAGGDGAEAINLRFNPDRSVAVPPIESTVRGTGRRLLLARVHSTLSGGAIVTRMGRDPHFAGLGRAVLLAREIERDRRPQGEGPPQT